jgi:hypothetical protein
MILYDKDINSIEEKDLPLLVQAAIQEMLNAFLSRTKANLLFEQVHLLMNNVAVRVFKDEKPISLAEELFQGDYAKFRDRFNEHREDHERVLYEKIFVDNYQSFEIFLSDLFKALYYSFPRFLTPDVINQDIGNIVYSDVFKSDSILRLRAAIIERKVKGIFQANNIAAALTRLEKTFDIELKIPKKDVEALLEIAFDRNILVHNNGVVNDIYVSGLNRLRITPKYKVEERIVIDDARVTDSQTLLQDKAVSISDIVIDKVSQITKYYKVDIKVCFDRTDAPNNGMHPTADTTAVIYLHGAARRVMPGVRQQREREGESGCED